MRTMTEEATRWKEERSLLDGIILESSKDLVTLQGQLRASDASKNKAWRRAQDLEMAQETLLEKATAKTAEKTAARTAERFEALLTNAYGRINELEKMLETPSTQG